jgi:hypothetical protein
MWNIGATQLREFTSNIDAIAISCCRQRRRGAAPKSTGVHASMLLGAARLATERRVRTPDPPRYLNFRCAV